MKRVVMVGVSLLFALNAGAKVLPVAAAEEVKALDSEVTSLANILRRPEVRACIESVETYQRAEFRIKNVAKTENTDGFVYTVEGQLMRNEMPGGTVTFVIEARDNSPWGFIYTCRQR